MKLTPRFQGKEPVPAALSTPHHRVGVRASTRIPSAGVVGHRETGDPSFPPLGSADPAPTPAAGKAPKTAWRRVRFVIRAADPLEISIHWLICAAALGGLLLGVLSL